MAAMKEDPRAMDPATVGMGNYKHVVEDELGTTEG
jgi:hypothetical protein